MAVILVSDSCHNCDIKKYDFMTLSILKYYLAMNQMNENVGKSAL